MKMEELISSFDNLKVSAMTKFKEVAPYINNVTIGPNRTICETKIANERKKIHVQEKVVTFSTNRSLEVPINKITYEIEILRKEKLQIAVSAHRSRILNFSKKLETATNSELLRRQQCKIAERQQQEMLILQALEQHDKSSSEEHEKLLQHYQLLAEKRRKYDDELQARQIRKQKINSIIDQIKKDQLELRNTYLEIVTIIKSCTSPNDLKMALGDIRDKLKSLPESMDEVVTRCKAGKISEEESKRSSELVVEIKNLKAGVQDKINEIENARIRNEAALQQKKEEEAQQKARAQQEISAPNTYNNVPIAETVTAKPVVSEIAKCVSRSSLKMFSELQEYLDNFGKSYKNLNDDMAYKQFKFDCRKAINIPVNAISTHSTQHMLDKYNRLVNLLLGRTVEVAEKQLNASKHPQGIAFCTDLLAKKFVLQGDLMISSKPDAAFCYSAMIIAIWNDFPDFGKLILAHFHRQCPYLVPLYPPRSVDQSDEDYYKSLGYQYIDGAIEKHDKFLKRMTGFMRLYGAILIAKPKRGQTGNPHNLSHAWRWFSSILNLEPHPDITSTMLHVFLETVGFAMLAAYGNMFHKMVMYIYVKLLPKLQKIDSEGPYTRLENILQNYKTRRSFERPSGMLPNNFW